MRSATSWRVASSASSVRPSKSAAALAMLEEVDPHLMFVNLGDIDRVGHSDPTGPLGIKAARRALDVETPVRAR